ncbi:AmmeMemoRadiSam system protein B [Candidatus Borreliella tachyglossi]|uniref:AmmeMemoRadiSam system protein B n=1 Tax=Candidatus Borreliella tachyglossi TaxID=1964448 RepID=A0A2S1LWR6_9SPIR|nr:AmmeMemoRadiSam system protein B [Candidatus Borreliella tachyglossi]AWG42734.1 AmmeMemoRadiSam system protein B [Candidatus Borreliella tachyglossi]
MVDNIFYSTNKFNLELSNLNKIKTHKALLISYGAYEFFLKNINLFQKVITENTKNVFIFSQTKDNSSVNISTHKAWKLLDETIDVNLDIIDLIKNFEFTSIEDIIIENDHKIEIVVNFIKDITKEIKIIPIILGNLKNQTLREFCSFLKPFTSKEENSFLFLSHFISHSTNLAKAIKLATTLKKLLIADNLDSSCILEYYNARKIFPENINAIIIIHKIFKKFEFIHYKTTSNNNEYSVIENILIS